MESATLPSTGPPSSSLLRQGWSRLLSPSNASPVAPATGPSHQKNQRYDSAQDPTAYRTTALRQPDSSPRPASRPAPVDNPSRHSSTPTRPVLVRAYSGDAQDRSTPPPPMSARRFLSLSGSRSSAPPRPSQSDIIFPADKDFSIESILQAIEPDIRGTLDSIAEICGRSKLSLSNEYGSHIAPLGEICAPSGALGPVEEDGPIEERRTDDSNAVIVDDEGSPVDPARDMHPFSFHRYLENLRQTASMQGRDGIPGQTTQGRPPLSPGMESEAGIVLAIAPETIPSTPFTREFASRPKHSGCDLLAKNAAGSDQQRSSQMATPAVVSEVHLEAIANDGSFAESNILPQPGIGGDGSPAVGSSGPDIIHSLLAWLKWAASIAGPESSPALQSAESQLRALLDRSGNEGASSTLP
ncbi:hypothetical protein E8E15_008105 [Penicillium rubens]|uniref:Pc21g15710 protein n=2 Tax=Penicillium chrysogenum species complex TaxID=254878 RepID=B6HK68_PENRW|nr:uncharacterized protein N7525_008106 [Penicillium rubens]KZN89175.1 hypothetical protein EN45_077690 [Penicillium chrysogenum]CAP96468.1 Pc21g15710 [Penicillium rubens Wisconsin 54-1255]KAF3021806.1 hypothetical protein E8E15_008105 [Penicillium rubens]KAJ5048717.1 hypothetical protein NUH16_007226 [Penicillium rubens]KAJ5829853.1 hypothetical protein N7525_008106 [Penicillium rubens]